MKKVIGAITGLGASLFFTATAFAQEAQGNLDLCPENPEGNGGISGYRALCNLEPGNALGTIITFILIIAVVIALIYLIWGGIKWITSGGDKGNVETARNQIIAAIIGLIVAFLAWFIISLITQLFFGQTIQDGLEIPQISPVEDLDNG